MVSGWLFLASSLHDVCFEGERHGCFPLFHEVAYSRVLWE